MKKKGGYNFVQNKIDPCIFFKPGVILISWVDDCSIFGKNKEVADAVIKSPHDDFRLTEEGNVSAYLEVQVDIEKAADNVLLTQPFLIQCVIDEMGDVVTLENVKNIPLVYTEILYKDVDGPARKQS